MLKLKQKISILLLICFMSNLSVRSIYADDVVPENKVTNLDEGQEAPFSGVLMTHDVAAKIIAEKKMQTELCESRSKEAKQLCDAKAKMNDSIATIELTSTKERCKEIIAIKTDRIDELTKSYTPPPWYNSPMIHFAGGVLIGALAILGGGYAVSQVAR